MTLRICVLFCAWLLATCVQAADEPIGPYLQRVSVNVSCPSSGGMSSVQGSGTICLSDVGGKPAAFILTAHHVVQSLREVKSVISPDGEERKQVVYRDAQIIQESVDAGRAVGEVKYDARVVNVDPRRDIALLRVRRGDFTNIGAKFYLDEPILEPGTPAYHAGAPGGKEIGGTCSLTDGIVSRIGVRIPEFGGSQHGVFDQVTCDALAGSSGGLVALTSDGRWIGMITLGLSGSDSFHWMVPVRSVREWAKEIKVEWLLDPGQPRPSETDLEKIPLELNPAGFASGEKSKASPTPAVRDEARRINPEHPNWQILQDGRVFRFKLDD